MKPRSVWTPWASLLLLIGILASCQQAATPVGPASAAPAAPPAARQATCSDSAIRLVDRGPGIHGAIVADTLHMGGATARVTCSESANQSLLLAGMSIPDDWTAQVRQSQYYLIVISYPGGNRLYVVSRRSDGTACVVDTNDECLVQVSDLPEDFDLRELPDDVAPTIPGGRAASAEPVATDTAPEAAGDPQPRNEATGVAVDAPLLSWSAADRATGYDLYWGTAKNLAADAALGTPIATSYTAVTIGRPGATAAQRRLAGATTYYWRVDAKNDAGTTRGNVWSFTTAAAPAAAAEPVAPAWPKAAHSFSWVDERRITPQNLAAPIGTPTPTLSVTAGAMPEGIELDVDSLRLDGTPKRRGHGSITITATNSAGTADTTVSWKVSCRHSDAEIEVWLQGLRQWEDIYELEDGTWGGESDSKRNIHALFSGPFRLLISVPRRPYHIVELPDGVRADDCQTIRGDYWLFGWEPSVEDFISCSPPWMAMRHPDPSASDAWRTSRPDFFFTVLRNVEVVGVLQGKSRRSRVLSLRAGTVYLLPAGTPGGVRYVEQRC